MKKRYIIYAPGYDDKIGGYIVLHKICDLLNQHGEKAYLIPFLDLDSDKFRIHGFEHILWHPIRTIKNCARIVKYCYVYKKKQLNKSWFNRVMNPLNIIFNPGLKNYIILYPEIVSGNPLNAKNVTRIFMHNPGNFTHEINYGERELYFRYSDSFAKDFTPNSSSKLSNSFLKVSTTPECFYPPKKSESRKGIAYAVRKGKGKPFVHNLENAILIDKLPLKEVAEIFREVEMFVSYDSATALSRYALLCHCPSIIILGDDETPSTYRPDINIANKFAYSITEAKTKDWDESYNWAENKSKENEETNHCSISNYIKETQDFFL